MYEFMQLLLTVTVSQKYITKTKKKDTNTLSSTINRGETTYCSTSNALVWLLIMLLSFSIFCSMRGMYKESSMVWCQWFFLVLQTKRCPFFLKFNLLAPTKSPSKRHFITICSKLWYMCMVSPLVINTKCCIYMGWTLYIRELK